jgi:hypothetical protein
MFNRLFRYLAPVWLLLAASSPAAADWMRAESDHFIVYSEGSEAQLRRQLTLLEDFHRLLQTLTNVRTEDPRIRKLPVYLVRGHGQLSQVARIGRTVAGFYAASPRGTAAFVDTEAGSGGGLVGQNEVLFHEYAHHFMMQHQGNVSYPPWYIEGFAEYLGTARFSEDRIEVGRPSEMRARFLRSLTDWTPTDDVLFRGARSDPLEAARFYAQSWFMTHYFFSDNARRLQLISYLNALAQGQPQRPAFRASFGMGPNDLHRRLLGYARTPLAYQTFSRPSAARAPQIAVTRLSNAAGEILLVHAGLALGGKPDASEMRRFRLAARSEDPFTLRALAEAEIVEGDRDAGERIVTRLLAAAPNDPELLYIRAMRHIAAGRALEGAERLAQFRLARPWLVRAHQADPNHVPTLYRYAQSFAGEPNFTSVNNINIMLLAVELAPQVGEIRLAAGSMLLMRGEFEQAERILQSLASTAHRGRISERARELVQKAVDRNNEGVTVEFDADEDED